MVDLFLSGRERSELFSSSEDSDDEDIPPAKRNFVPTEETLKFWDSVPLKPLKNEKRKAAINKFPIPSCDPAHPPKLDESVSSLVPKSAKTYDSFLSKLQRFTLDAAGPLLWMLNERSEGRDVDVEAAVRASLALLGNASAHFSVERRRAILKHLNKDLKPLADADFPKKGPYLFGDDIGKQTKKMADNVSALKGLQSRKTSNPSCFSGSSNSNRKTNTFKSQSRHGSWGTNSRRSVFGRLDSLPSRVHKPFKQQQKEQSKQDPIRTLPHARICVSQAHLYRKFRLVA